MHRVCTTHCTPPCRHECKIIMHLSTDHHRTTPIFICIKWAQQPSSLPHHLQLLLVDTTMHWCTNYTVKLSKSNMENYMGKWRNHTTWPTHFPCPLYNLCPLQETDTCLHLLFMCTKTALNNRFRIGHNVVLQQIHKLLFPHFTTWETFLMNACNHLGTPAPPKNTTLHGYTHAFASHDLADASPQST